MAELPLDDITPEPGQVAASAAGKGEVLPDNDSACWLCGAPVVKRHCKIVCPRCGFMRDCSDP